MNLNYFKGDILRICCLTDSRVAKPGGGGLWFSSLESGIEKRDPGKGGSERR